MNIINYYYNTLSTLKMAKPILKDIEKLSFAENTNTDNIKYVIGKIVPKYKKELDYIGTHYTDKVVLSPKQAVTYYETTSDEDVNYDLHYLIDCLVIIGSYKVGLIENMDEILTQITF